MDVGISIGQSHHYQLSDALLLYKSQQTYNSRGPSTYVTHHPVLLDKEDRLPKLGPAKPVTLDFIESLVQSLGGYLDVELLPENVLARSQRTLAWWTPRQTRRMYFVDKEGLKAISGSVFPQPALVWMTTGQELMVRALKENKRPEASTKLCVAPYWNLSESGTVCQGSMRSPKKSTVASIRQWEASFFESEFTHGNVGRMTRRQGGFKGLWQSLVGKRTFPADTLIQLPQTLEQFLTAKGFRR